jgi:hypothetical protein
MGWETAGALFVADDLGTWLVGLLAEAGRKRLTKLVLGSDQERALRQAAAVAVALTAAELDRTGGGRGGQLAMVISEVFGEQVPGGPLAGQATVLELSSLGAQSSGRHRCSGGSIADGLGGGMHMSGSPGRTRYCRLSL